MISRAPKGRSKVSNSRELFIEGDARLKASRRFRDGLASVATDLRGVERRSKGRRQIVNYGLLTDPLGRAFQHLVLRWVAHDVTPDLGTYLTTTATAKPQDGLASDEPKRPPAANVVSRRA
jgi:hypothetical protein